MHNAANKAENNFFIFIRLRLSEMNPELGDTNSRMGICFGLVEAVAWF